MIEKEEFTFRLRLISESFSTKNLLLLPIIANLANYFDIDDFQDYQSYNKIVNQFRKPFSRS